MECRPTDKEIRERLISRGVRALSDCELLSTIITADDSFETARRLLANYDNSLTILSNTDINALRRSSDLGVRNAAMICAAAELGRRIAEATAPEIRCIKSSQDIIDIFTPTIGQLKHEEMWALYLSNSNTILDKIKISQGGVHATIFDHKIIVKRAVELLATGIILVHNHPSGNTTPSENDILNTRKAIMAASLFDITILDHLIITANDSFSLRQHNMLEE